MKRTHWLATLLLLPVLLALLLCGCSGSEAYAAKLQKRITVTDISTKIVDGDQVLQATVRMPDYSALMEDCYPQAEEAAKDEEDFEAKLYALVLEQAETDTRTVTRDVEVNLMELDPERENWSDQALDSAARQAAFDAEVEEFCWMLVTGALPQGAFEEVP